MKKRTSKLMCLALVCLLTASMVIPVMASISGDGTSKSGYYYRFSITKDATSGTAYIATPNIPNNVTATAVNNITDPVTKEPTTIDKTVTGYVNVTATAGNTIKINGTTYTVPINSTSAILKVGDEVVVNVGDYAVG